MGFRFRIGPFTFGRSGIRLSPWFRGGGVSIPLTGKGRLFGKLRFGPVSWYLEDSSKNETIPQLDVSVANSGSLETYELAAISAFQSDRQLLNRLKSSGVPWRGIQERLKEALPPKLPDLDTTAYRLVPKAMQSAFGEQGVAWHTESRPSKSGKGRTTWVVVN